MDKIFKIIGISTFVLSSSASADVFNVGDKNNSGGSLVLNGSISGKYIYKDFDDKKLEGDKNGSLSFNNLKLKLNYENPFMQGFLDTRCHQNKKLCDTIFLKEAWLAYKITNNQKLIVGQQSVDFGFSSIWGESYYGSLFYEAGLDNSQKLGLKYKLDQDTNHLTLGFYANAGGNNKGDSKHARYYSANFVEAEDLKKGTYIKEKNMIVARVSKDIHFDVEKNFNTEIGASYWHSTLNNIKTKKDGKRDAWSIFTKINYQNLQWLGLFGQQKINNADLISPDYSTFGAFNDNWQVANSGKMLMTELNYTIKEPFKNIKEIKPYITFSKFIKDKRDYLDSQRVNIGLTFPVKDLVIMGEYIISKNDYGIGGSADAMAKGDNNKLNKLVFISAEYNF